MKGLKCFTKYQKLFIILALLLVPFFILLKNTNSASAVSLTASGVVFDYQETPQSSYLRSSVKNIPGPSGVIDSNSYINPVFQIRLIELQFDSTSFQGDHAALHFETNVVWDNASQLQPSWTNLDQISVKNCFVINGPLLSIESQSLNFNQTSWLWDNQLQRYVRNTLTIYGDVTLSGFPSSSGQISCYVGSSSYPFLYSGSFLNTLVWVEQNPATINYSNNLQDALLQQQINQNTTIINQNQQQIDQDNQDRADLQNTSDTSQSDASDAAASVTSGFSSLTSVIGGFVNIVLHPPASNCIIDADMGHMDLGDIDLCQLSPPPAIQVIATLIFIGFIIPFAYSLIMFLLKLLGDITEGS